MKTVFSNRQCAHVWAQQTQATGRGSAHSVRFSLTDFYSYGTVIAKVHQGVSGQRFALISSNKYSTTTSRHVYHAERACGFGCFRVPFIGAPGGWNHADSVSMTDVHAGNMLYFQDSQATEVTRLSRAITRFNNYTLVNNASDCRDYCAAFGLPVPDWSDSQTVGRVFAELTASYEARQVKRNSPEAIAKAQAKSAAADARRAAKLQEALADAILQFRTTGRVAYALHMIPPMLRLVTGTGADRVQTSHGAEVSFRVAAVALDFIRNIWMTEREWRGKVGVEPFTLTTITETHVTVGCHRFERKEIEDFMRIVGVL